ncbi:Hypothetical protein D9617_5g068990 [Elsinoe fawcettii]|nr:Hypothetical protein D9617_5g068990 [Elsinoe fawcettii]
MAYLKAHLRPNPTAFPKVYLKAHLKAYLEAYLMAYLKVYLMAYLRAYLRPNPTAFPKVYLKTIVEAYLLAERATAEAEQRVETIEGINRVVQELRTHYNTVDRHLTQERDRLRFLEDTNRSQAIIVSQREETVEERTSERDSVRRELASLRKVNCDNHERFTALVTQLTAAQDEVESVKVRNEQLESSAEWAKEVEKSGLRELLMRSRNPC